MSERVHDIQFYDDGAVFFDGQKVERLELKACFTIHGMPGYTLDREVAIAMDESGVLSFRSTECI